MFTCTFGLLYDVVSPAVLDWLPHLESLFLKLVVIVVIVVVLVGEDVEHVLDDGSSCDRTLLLALGLSGPSCPEE